jgi:hypothetical protein
MVLMVATAVPRLSGSTLSARMAEAGGYSKTMKPWMRAARAIHSQLGAKT